MRWVVGAVAGFGRLPNKVVRMKAEDGVEAEPGGEMYLAADLSLDSRDQSFLRMVSMS